MKQDFGQKLKRLREIHGYSQEAVAFYCGISQAAYSKKEKGSRIPSYERLRQLGELYEIQVEDIVHLSLDELLIMALRKQISQLTEKQSSAILGTS